ncbi:DNA polymerase delta subunit 4 [Petromyzon marinus]|uniref:DNA polymerase delta subunit 4 n=1 Tax=Petromyzon marinus TaxID=7757 RepID=UPI003F706A82
MGNTAGTRGGRHGGDKGETRGRGRHGDKETEVEAVESLEAAIERRDLDQLRAFDLAMEYGPCTGITRLERWTRAESLALGPPCWVKAMVEGRSEDVRFTHSVWHGYPL